MDSFPFLLMKRNISNGTTTRAPQKIKDKPGSMVAKLLPRGGAIKLPRLRKGQTSPMEVPAYAALTLVYQNQFSGRLSIDRGLARHLSCPPSLWRSGGVEGLPAVILVRRFCGGLEGWPADHLMAASFT